MKKEHTVKPNSLQMKTIESYYQRALEAETRYNKTIVQLERYLEKMTGIIGIEFFFCDNELAGVGNRARTMNLIPIEKLIKGGVI